MPVCRGLLGVSVVMVVGVLFLMPTCFPALPTNTDTRTNTIHNIVNIAQTTLVHIRRLGPLPTALQIDVGSPSIGGLHSISQHLSELGGQLQDSRLGALGQIHADVSSLGGSVRYLAETMNCLLAPTAPSPSGTGLASNDFPESHYYVSLRKVQVYLDNLLLHRDKLTAC